MDFVYIDWGFGLKLQYGVHLLKYGDSARLINNFASKNSLRFIFQYLNLAKELYLFFKRFN